MENSRHKKTSAPGSDEVLGNEINFEEEIVMNENNTPAVNVIPFRSAKLLLVEHGGQPYVPMKPIVDGMGLDWKTQHRKLTSGRFKPTMVDMTIVAADGKLREMTCMPLRKLTGWMMSIHPEKIQDADRKDAIMDYQNECDDVLWAYWNEGQVVNHRGPDQVMTVLGQTIGTDGFHMLGAVVKGKVSNLPAPAQRRATSKLWAQIHAAFGVRSAADIPADQLDAARNFIAAYVVLEGEYLPREPKSERLNIHFPIQALAGRRQGMLTDRGDGRAWLDVKLEDVGYHHDSLCELIIFELQRAGYVVDAAQWELATYRNKLSGISSFVTGLNRVVEDPHRYAVDSVNRRKTA